MDLDVYGVFHRLYTVDEAIVSRSDERHSLETDHTVNRRSKCLKLELLLTSLQCLLELCFLVSQASSLRNWETFRIRQAFFSAVAEMHEVLVLSRTLALFEEEGKGNSWNVS